MPLVAVMISCSILSGFLLLLVKIGLGVGLSCPIRIIMRLNEVVLPRKRNPLQTRVMKSD